ncbi:heterokaryon incompatibility protein [Diplodia corticola]|uniref:Heterokaryon incompatibility protein n=1 Tax=Diplodia corticola TaxID=236234 RepID=A0A1J9QK99_9PEZI|nr:heterokaryon incompatibility protein [Diplodia corticola]OJD28904.1 heterokaryon incompatibility protein [Diplodia corticola]
MASASDEPDEFGTTARHSAPNPATTGDALCDLCLQALTIDDKLAGGTVTEAPDKEAPVLDLSGFAPQQWTREDQKGLRHSRVRKRSETDEFGWTHHGFGPFEKWRLRGTCAGNNHERSATPPTLPELAGSADQNCLFCSRLTELFYEQYGEKSWWNLSDSRLRFSMQYEWEELRIEIKKVGEEMTVHYREMLDCLAVIVFRPEQYGEVDVYEFEVGAKPGNCRDWLKIMYNPLDIDGPASKNNIEFMKSCIDECVREHLGCRDKLSKENFIPTRLLDVGSAAGSDVRLRERREILSECLLGSQLKYATLSYCWGSSLPLKTTDQTFEQHKIGISVDGMPATFQDAVKLARELGIRYLWIDALCIIQDQVSKKDWEAESVTMTDIFAHSYVTICAAVSDSCFQNFLQRPSSRLLSLPFRSSLVPDISGEYSILLKGREERPERACFRSSRWSRRAWVWQEQVMATRQLVFCEEAVQFRCNNKIVFEYGLEASDLSMVLQKGSDYSRFWLEAVFVYSRRELTFAHDRLSAISGVAKFMQDSMKELGEPTEYLAGLWLDKSLGYQLRWVCDEPKLSYNEMLEWLQDEEHYCAPSWSWASRNTAIRCLRDRPGTEFQVVSYDLQPANSDAMVAVKFGSSITLGGKCRRTPIRPISGIFTPRIPERWPYSNYWKTSSPYGTMRFWLDWVPNLEDPEESNRQDQLHLFLTSTEGDRFAGGLLVLPSEGDDSGRELFYRVGAFNIDGDCQWLTETPKRSVTIV